jgi:NAD(P)-dependent dehydrogenase (short-subunit alcohol dehydrogenase family)
MILVTKLYHHTATFVLKFKNNKKMSSLKNKVAVVTGGNSGIGYASAKELMKQGATVVITGRRKEAVEKAASETGAIPFIADQSSLSDTVGLVREISRRFSKVDILFINAGINKMAAIESVAEKDFDDIMDVNFKGAYFTLSKFIPILKDGASVILLSSIGATKTAAGASVYYASKAALNSFAKNAALELAPRKIRVNIVSPGVTDTEILGKIGLDEVGIAQLKGYMTNKIPLGRLGQPEEVADMVAYLAGDKSAYITGSEFVIDGGYKL